MSGNQGETEQSEDEDFLTRNPKNAENILVPMKLTILDDIDELNERVNGPGANLQTETIFPKARKPTQTRSIEPQVDKGNNEDNLKDRLNRTKAKSISSCVQHDPQPIGQHLLKQKNVPIATHLQRDNKKHKEKCSDVQQHTYKGKQRHGKQNMLQTKVHKDLRDRNKLNRKPGIYLYFANVDLMKDVEDQKQFEKTISFLKNGNISLCAVGQEDSEFDLFSIFILGEGCTDSNHIMSHIIGPISSRLRVRVYVDQKLVNN